MVSISYFISGDVMKNLICYKTLPVWNAQTLPKQFREQHNTQTGTWAKLNIIKGYVNFDILTEQGDIISEHVFNTQH